MKKQLLAATLTLLAAAKMFALPPLLGTSDFKASTVKHLDFSMSWENLEIKKTSSSRNTISVEVYCNKKKFAPKVKLSGSTLVIDSVPASTLILSLEKKSCTVVVYIPSDITFEKAHISLSSGSIKEVEALSAQTLSLSASSGSVNANQINANKAVFHTSSGNIKTKALQAKTADFSASSGSIKISDVTVNDISITTSSGTISAAGLLADQFTASASSGTIGLELRDAPSKNSSITTSSGTIFVSLPKNAAATINATTSSGGFTNAFTNEKISSHVDYQQMINGGGARISLHASSGHITVDVGDGISASANNKNCLVSEDDEDIPVVNLEKPIF